MKCSECVYYHDNNGPDENVGQCRRLPPLILHNTMVIEDESVSAIVADGVFPRTAGDSWCGEHRDKAYDN